MVEFRDGTGLHIPFRESSKVQTESFSFRDVDPHDLIGLAMGWEGTNTT